MLQQSFETDHEARRGTRGSSSSKVTGMSSSRSMTTLRSIGIGMVLVETSPEQPKGQLEAAGAILNLVTVVIGAGVVALPRAVGASGVFGGFGLLCFCGTLGVTMVWTMCSSCDLAEKEGHSISSYDDLGFAAWGSLGHLLTIAAVNLTLYGVCCIIIFLLGLHISLVVDGARGVPIGVLNDAQSFPLGQNAFGGWMVVIAIILVPLSWFQDMSAISRFAWIGVAGSFGVCIASFIGAIACACNNGLENDPGKRLVLPNTFEDFVSSLCTLLFSYAGISVIPTMRTEMRDPMETSTACGRAMMIVTALYMLIATPAVLAWGIPGGTVVELMEGNIFIDIAKYAAILCVIANLILTYPILLNVTIKTIGIIAPVIIQPGVLARILRSLLVVVSFLVAFFCTSLGQMLELVAAVTICSTMLYLNLGFYWTFVIRREGSFAAAIRAEPLVKVVWHALVFVAGIIASVTGVRGALSSK